MRTKVRAAEGSEDVITEYRDLRQSQHSVHDLYRLHGPLDFISDVHRCSSSATSSESTLVRIQASDHCGFFLVTPMVRGAELFRAVSSLLLKTLEKNGMLANRSKVAKKSEAS